MKPAKRQVGSLRHFSVFFYCPKSFNFTAGGREGRANSKRQAFVSSGGGRAQAKVRQSSQCLRWNNLLIELSIFAEKKNEIMRPL